MSLLICIKAGLSHLHIQFAAALFVGYLRKTGLAAMRNSANRNSRNRAAGGQADTRPARPRPARLDRGQLHCHAPASGCDAIVACLRHSDIGIERPLQVASIGPSSFSVESNNRNGWS